MEYSYQKVPKQIYNNDILPSNLYIFELKIYFKDNTKIDLKKIKHSKKDSLIDIQDKILFKKIKSFELIGIDFNDTNKTFMIKDKINKMENIFKNDKITIIFNEVSLGYTELNYHIN